MSTRPSIQECWTNEDDRISGFVVIAKTRERSIPYLISAYCDIEADIYPPGKEFLEYLNAIYILGDDGLLERKDLYFEPLSSNAISHSPIPELNSRVFYFVGELKSERKNNLDFFRIVDADIYTELGLNFGQFIEITPQERYELTKEFELR
ncbi:hypothetical protein [Parasphingorhabdus sp.]|uniref:hypothetical protein n=1 Tax=Parasphingorhabdus sp. TaxID=2709688 RepID=UPI002F940CFD